MPKLLNLTVLQCLKKEVSDKTDFLHADKQ